MKQWLIITGTIVVLDQLTKYLASSMLGFHQPHEVLPYFNLTLMHNPGAAFSFLSDAGGWQRWLFTAIAAGVSVVLVLMLRKLPAQERLSGWGLALILGGAVGNLIDRVLYGYVIDFVQVYYSAQSCIIGFSPFRFDAEQVCIWPAFNIADASITVGAILYIVDSLFIQPRRKKHS